MCYIYKGIGGYIRNILYTKNVDYHESYILIHTYNRVHDIKFNVNVWVCDKLHFL